MSFWSGLGKVLKVGAPLAASFIPGVGPLASKALSGIGSVAGAISDSAGKVGEVATGAATGLRNERFDEDQARRDRDRLALGRTQTGIDQTQARDRFGLDRARTQIDQTQTRDQFGMNRAALIDRMLQDRAKLGIDAPMARTKQAAYGDALKNVQDVNLNFQPTTGTLPTFGVSGGLRPSMFGANARAAGGELSTQALQALRSKSDIPGMVDVPEASALTDLPEASPLVDLPELSTPQGSGALEKITGGIGLGGNILGALGPILAGLKKRREQTPETMRTPPLRDPTLMTKVQF